MLIKGIQLCRCLGGMPLEFISLTLPADRELGKTALFLAIFRDGKS